jgi:hypothetical protein
MCRSERPVAQYDKRTEARDIHEAVRGLGYLDPDVIGHELGAMFAYTPMSRSSPKKPASSSSSSAIGGTLRLVLLVEPV